MQHQVMKVLSNIERRDIGGALIAAFFVGVLGTYIISVLDIVSLSPFFVFGILFFAVWLYVVIGSIASSFFPSLLRIVKFALVGGVNTLVDVSVLNLLMVVSDIYTGVYFSLFKGISFLVALANSYIWNALWTFQSDRTTRKKIQTFVIVSLGGLVVNVVSAYGIQILLASFGLSGQLFSTIAALGAVALSMVWNFVGYSKFVFD